MVKLLKLKQEIIWNLFLQNKLDPRINKEKLEIYFMLLGYFVYKNDMPLLDKRDILNDINYEIIKLLDIKYINFFRFSSNSLESFEIATNMLYQECDKVELDNLINYFYQGYDYCKVLYVCPSIMDYLILKKGTKSEIKLLKIMEQNKQLGIG